MIRRLALVRAGGTATSVLLASLLFSHAGAHAQQPNDSVRVELARLSALVDSLGREVRRLQSGGQPEEQGDALARLRAAAQAAAAAGGGAPAAAPATQEFVGRQRSLQALNPEISVSADVFGHVNKDATNQDNFFAREFEISLVSNLDPYSRAKVFLSRETPGGEISPFPEEGEEEAGGSFSVEEGFVEWVGLPGNLSFKLGRFFQQFGQLNRWHSHALNFQSRSLPHLAFIGEENLGQTGASIHWLMPFGGDGGGTYETTLEVTTKGNELLFGGAQGVSLLGNLNGFWTLTESTDLDLSLSWMSGRYDDGTDAIDRNLYGAEMAFTWRPPGRSLYRGVTLRGGVMALEGLVGPADPEQTAWGFWTQGETRLSQSWLAGARFDRTENPADPTETAWLVSPTITWWQSEFVRIRVEYDLVGRSFMTNRDGQLLFQVTFAMGPHKHETY